jgi:hypothetical protein
MVAPYMLLNQVQVRTLEVLLLEMCGGGEKFQQENPRKTLASMSRIEC